MHYPSDLVCVILVPTSQQLATKILQTHFKMSFSPDQVQELIGKAVTEALKAAKSTPTSAHSVMEHLNTRIPRFSYNEETGHTFEKWYVRHSSILKTEGAVLPEIDRIRLVISKLNTNEYDHFVNYIRPTKVEDSKPKETIEILKKIFSTQVTLFKRRMRSLNLKRDGRSLKELTSAINEAAEEAEWGDITLDEMKQYILMLSLQSHDDSDTRTRAARLLEQDRDLSFSQIMDDLDHFESIKRDLCPANKKYINRVHGQSSRTTKHHAQKASAQKSIVSPSYICYRCNKPNHHSNDCKYKTYECEKCSKIGHLSNACKSRTNNQQPGSSRNNDTPRRQVNAVATLTNRVTKTVTINGIPTQLTLDTGAQVSLISTRIWAALGKPKLETPSVSLTVADGRSLKVLGTLACTVKFNNIKFHGECHVTDNCKLLGLDWITRDPHLRSLLTSDTRPQILQVERCKPGNDSESLETSRKKLN